MKYFASLLSCFILITLISILFSCKKTGYEKPAYEKFYGSWKMTSLTISPGFTGTEDIFIKSQLDACGRDNIYTFAYSLFTENFRFQRGATNCDSTNTPDQSGYWNFNDTTKILVFDFNHFNPSFPPPDTNKIYDMTITQLTDEEFTGNISRTIDGVFYTDVWSFIKQ